MALVHGISPSVIQCMIHNMFIISKSFKKYTNLLQFFVSLRQKTWKPNYLYLSAFNDTFFNSVGYIT
jgi:hypothetical protein